MSSGVNRWNPPERTMPALLITASMRPKCSSAVATAARAPSGSATECASATATPPDAVISSTTCWALPPITFAPIGCRAQIVDHDARPRSREEMGIGPSQPGTASGHEDHVSCEVHGDAPLLVPVHIRRLQNIIHPLVRCAGKNASKDRGTQP